MAGPARKRVRAIRAVAWVVCLLPAVWLIALWREGDLGADPVGFLTNETGIVSLRLLIATLVVTPAYWLLRWPVLPPLRRVLGLGSFFYACAHLFVYLGLNQYLEPGFIVRDLARPYILAGYLSWALAIPLAMTSTDAMMRRLGYRWKRLHRLVYLVAIAAVLHYALLIKIDFDPAIRYSLVLGVLLAVRLAAALRRRGAQTPVPADARGR